MYTIVHCSIIHTRNVLYTDLLVGLYLEIHQSKFVLKTKQQCEWSITLRIYIKLITKLLYFITVHTHVVIKSLLPGERLFTRWTFEGFLYAEMSAIHVKLESFSVKESFSAHVTDVLRSLVSPGVSGERWAAQETFFTFRTGVWPLSCV